MPVHEHRRLANQPGYPAGHGTMVAEADRLFADALRRLLLKAVAMLEDRYGLKPINANRTPTPR